MNRLTARTRRWMLWAAPLMALCGLRWRAGGAALGLAVWLGLGRLLSSPPVYPYPRKQRPVFHRLFLGFSVCAFLTGIAHVAARRFFPYLLKDDSLNELLFRLGAIGFALPIGQKAIHFSLPRKLSLAIALLLCVVFLFSIIIE